MIVEWISWVLALPLLTKVAALGGCFVAITLLWLILTLCSTGVKALRFEGYDLLVNATTVLLFCLLFTEKELKFSLIMALAFWCVGRCAYFLLRLIFRRQPQKMPTLSQPPPQAPPTAMPHLTVRLEHALSMCDKLLLRPLGRGDRQEVEKIRYALGLMEDKQSFTLEEGDCLSQSFNSLLKLMAKYQM